MARRSDRPRDRTLRALSAAGRVGALSGLWIVALGPVAGCGAQEEPEAPPPRVEVVQPLVREVVDWDEYTGRLQAVESVEVRPRVSGYLESIHFEDGAIVEAGDLLFVIDPRPYAAELAAARAELTRAKAQADLARIERTRAARLLESRTLSQEDFDRRATTLQDLKAEVLAVEAAVEAARLDVEFTEIRAPIRGRVGDRAIDVGNLITGGTAESTLLTTIVSLDPVYCYFDADERDVLKYIRMGQTGERVSGREVAHPLLLKLSDEEGFPHRGSLDFIDNRIDPSTGTMRARGVFSNPDFLLIPGLFGRIRIAGSGRYRGLLIPDRAIGTDQSQQYVYVVGADGTVEYRVVEPGPRIDGLRVVRKGISPEDRVLVSGLQQVRPGQSVEALEIAVEIAPEALGFVDLLAPPAETLPPATRSE